MYLETSRKRKVCRTVRPQMDTQARQRASIESGSSQANTLYPASEFMRLGKGLSNKVISRNISCFDLGIKEIELVQPSLSECDLFSLFTSSDCEKNEESSQKLDSNTTITSSMQHMELSSS